MPTYRVVADHGLPEPEFKAEDDAAGERLARRMSASLGTTSRVGFQLEKRSGDGWVVVAAWIPRRVRQRSGGGLDHMVAPEPPDGSPR